MNTLSREELKAALDRAEPIRLVMALGRRQFQLKHIPGSLQFDNPTEALQALGRDERIVLYCTGGACAAGPLAYRLLAEHGYTNLALYPGGLPDWEAAGYPLAGILAEHEAPAAR